MNQDENEQGFKKKMPILFILLFAVGVCLLLTRSVNIDEITKTVDVAICTKSLPSGTVVTHEHINTEVVSRDELPQGQKLVRLTQVIGRVLSIPVVEGQLLTESCFVPAGSASDLIAHIPQGMRAFTVSVSRKGMPDRALLNPGCVVDVLVAYKLSSRDAVGDALSTTMLRGIQVLAISGDVVVTNPDNGDEKEAKTRDTRQGDALVTLLVDTKQAEALQLAQDNGSVTLSIRNPGDKKEFDQDPTILKKGKLTTGGTDLEASVKNESPEREPVQTLDESTSNNLQQNGASSGIEAPYAPVTQPRYEIKSNNRRKQAWEVEVIQGRERKVQEFENTEK